MTRLPGLQLLKAGPSAAPSGPVLQSWRDNGRLVATGGMSNDGWWMLWNGLATFWFGETGDVTARPLRSDLGPNVRDIFTRGILPTVMIARGLEAIHASAVLQPCGVIALCGESGAGKSSLALALASRSGQHFADDALVIDASVEPAVAVKLPFPARVDEEARTAIGVTEVTEATVHTAPIHTVYILKREAELTDNRPQFVAVEPAKRFNRLLAYAHQFEMGPQGRRRLFLEAMLRLARRTPVFECRFAPDIAALPALAESVRTHASQVASA